MAPTRRDGEVTCALLGNAGIACEALDDVDALVGTAEAGVGAIMLTDATLASHGIERLFAFFARQPDWSDIPVILLTPDRRHSAATATALEAFTNVTLLDRPVSTRSMLSAVLAALRARRRQYELRDQMVELREAERALREADRRKDEFLATLAHELRNPLAPIRTGLEVLERIPGDGAQATRIRTIMERQLAQLVKLIDDLLDVSRIATGKVVLQREVVDLRDVIESAIEGSQPLIADAGHELIVTTPAQPVAVFADPLRLGQVIGNLVNNATKYTPRGGRIEVTLAREGEDAVVRVSDNGVGIPAGMLDQVFDMFAQVDRTLDQSQGGLGIGLSLVRQLMELHGGRVEARSLGVDRGSTFTLRLRATDLPAREVPAPVAPQSAPQSRPRVLVVDDNADAADSLAVFLDMEGYETRVEYTARGALRTAGAFRPKAVVCDIGLPQMDGCEVARRLRADPDQAGALLVALTGLGSEEDKRRTRAAGFDMHLVKPVALPELRRILSLL
jgi:signal transduction histidine kinase/CheY-like chemotaxis protein